MRRRLVVIGHPDGRRVRDYCGAAKSAGFDVQVYAHGDLAKNPDLLLEAPNVPTFVRMDSAGEDFETQTHFLLGGASDAESDGRCQRVGEAQIRQRHPRELLAPRQAHYGYLRYLRALEERFDARPEWRLLSAPAELRRFFDKNESAAWLADHHHPITEGAPAPFEAGALEDLVDRRGWSSTFVKIACSSSASGLAIYRRGKGRRTLYTTLKAEGGRWFNSLKMQRVDAPLAIDERLAFLLGEASRAEREHIKARHDKRHVDLRVLCIDGEPTFFVLRQNTHPVTNLHLGGGRGDLESFRQRIDASAWAAMEATCRRVAEACASFHVALDILFESDMKTHRIIELNAFGDLLPGLKHKGATVYESQVERLKRSGQK